MNFSVPFDVVLSIYMYMNNFLVRPIDTVGLTTKHIVVGRQNHISTQKGPKARWPKSLCTMVRICPIRGSVQNQNFNHLADSY